jgi:hypothetical protein
MCIPKWPLAILAGVVLVLVSGLVAQDAEPQQDQLCRMLFDTYMTGRGKIQTRTITAASHIVAERGRDSGFWRHVLKELQRNNEASELGCVRVLGKMLEVDALARDVIKREKETGQVGQWAASVCLGPDVVRELISRGEKADSSRVGYYAIALARARVPESVDFFRMILRDGADRYDMDTAKFYAAVGLAQLRDPAGMMWLIAQSDNRNLDVRNAYPRGIRYAISDTYVTMALRRLTGQENLTTQQEWEAWWERADSKAYPKSRVEIVDPW